MVSFDRLIQPQPGKSLYWRVFWLCFALAAALFLPHCIADLVQSGSFFHYAGDFNDQQIPFYSYANHFIKEGGSFSWATDLGSGFANAYSFYLLGSPFFWLTMLLPSWLTPWCMVPMLCLKFAAAGGGAYRWMRRWVKDEGWSVFGALLYAFSGFSVYNVFFNHFLDVVALFPYLLASLDETVLDGKRGRFPLWVALNILNNYFFFVGQAVFLVIYYVCMCAGKKYRVPPRLFATLALETLLGCMMGCVLLLPAGLSLLQNPRTIDPFNGYGYLTYSRSQQYLAILYSAFLMPDAPFLTDLFSEGVLKWTSMSAYLPLVGIAGALAFARLRRGHPFTYIVKCCVVCAFVPVLNSMFYAFNSSYYARWYYMPVLVMAAMTAGAFKSRRAREGELRRAAGLVAVATFSAVAFALVPNEDEKTGLTIGVVNNQYRFWAIFAVSMVGVVVLVYLLEYARRHPQKLAGRALACLLAFSFVYGSLHLSLTKYSQWDHDAAYYESTAAAAGALNEALPDDAFYRIDAYDCYNNMGLWLDKSCIQCFHSTVAPSILEFYPSVGVTRDVNSKPGVELYALRGLLSVRFTLVPTGSNADWAGEKAAGWHVYKTAAGYTIYENENWVPMGFTYDHYITEAQFEALPEASRGNALMKALLLTDEQIAAYGDLLTPLDDAALDTLDEAGYAGDCAARRAAGVTGFTATNTGFTATADLDAANLVFFSVPYDDGFTATVNGRPAEVLKVDNGLMAVAAPAGESEIVFTYHTPGLKLSLTVAAIGLAAYLALAAKRRAAVRASARHPNS